jgi:uncharacterized protein YcbX
MLALVNTPGLARLNVRFDGNRQRLIVALGNDTLANEALDANGRKHIANAIADYVLTLEENPLTKHPEKLPLRVVGDGVTPRYHDSETGQITLHSRESLTKVATAIGHLDINERRFRSNIAIEGVTAWEEQRWVGRQIQIGAVEFDVVRTKQRCLATHANPETGQRDLQVLTTLTKKMGQEKPIFAIVMVPSKGSGEIRVGDEVRVVDRQI